MLTISNLSFDYQDHALLNRISLRVDNGQILHVKGANGAGKTTLLKLIAGLQGGFEGTIFYNGVDIFHNLNVYQQQICYIGHKVGLNLALTVRENCFFDIHQNSSLNMVQLLEYFNLNSYADTVCNLLSAGQKRRVTLLRLWTTLAPLWILDEPFTALDTYAIKIVLNKLITHCQAGGQIIITSHQSLSDTGLIYNEYSL